jgi:putative ABC transport system substrate-binding protein
MTRRRDLLKLALAVPLLAPLGVRAQAEKARRIGLLIPGTPEAGKHNLDVLLDGLRDLGYVEGRNLVVERRYAGGREDRLAALATELVRQEVELIVAAGPAASLAARSATSTVPIVAGTHDPVEQGLIASLARPGGNLTGFCVLSSEAADKQLALLKEVLPRLKRVGLLAIASTARHVAHAGQVAASARKLGMGIALFDLAGPQSLEPAFAAMRSDRAEAFIVIPDAEIDAMRAPLVAAAAKHRLPGMYTWRFYADAGGLMSYGPNLRTLIATWPGYVDKILKGARPGELPMMTPTKYELVLNERAARELGFTFPGAVQLAADHIIN